MEASYNNLFGLLGRIEGVLKRVQIYTKAKRPTLEMTEVVIKIIAELISVLALANKQVTQSIWSKSLFTNKGS